MSKKDQNRMFTWLFAAVIIFGSFLWIMFNGGNSSDPISDDGSVNIPELSENEWVKGNAESDIVLIEYSDFQCQLVNPPFLQLKVQSASSATILNSFTANSLFALFTQMLKLLLRHQKPLGFKENSGRCTIFFSKISQTGRI